MSFKGALLKEAYSPFYKDSNPNIVEHCVMKCSRVRVPGSGTSKCRGICPPQGHEVGGQGHISVYFI